MPQKTLILSSAGLKNVIENENSNRDFTFIFGQQKLIMSNFFAEFISPKVSKLHQSDSTIHFISYDTLIDPENTENNQFLTQLFDSDILTHITQLSHGEEIELNEEEIRKLLLISIILENEELFSKLSDFYFLTSDTKENFLDHCINDLKSYEIMRKHLNNSNFDFTRIIDQISKNFYSIDKNKLKILPHSLLLNILSNNNLKLESEDSLFDFINDYCEDKNDILFYEFCEKLQLSELSEDKFREFLSIFDINNMTNTIWSNLQDCFYCNYNKSKDNATRYNSERPKRNMKQTLEIKYEDLKFEGIIHHLTKQCHGNVDDQNCVKITSSSTLNSKYLPKYAADFTDTHFFHSGKSGFGEQGQWITYDFMSNKISLTHYSIRTNNDGNFTPRNWVIEGSNTGKWPDWTILDRQENCSFFQPHIPASHTFEIKSSSWQKKYYRYIRMRSTGPNNNNQFYLSIDALEYFGSISPNES